MSCEWDLGVHNPELSASPIVTKWVRRGEGELFYFFFLSDIDSCVLFVALLLLFLLFFLVFFCEVWNFRTALISGLVYQGLSQFLSPGML